MRLSFDFAQDGSKDGEPVEPRPSDAAPLTSKMSRVPLFLLATLVGQAAHLLTASAKHCHLFVAVAAHSEPTQLYGIFEIPYNKYNIFVHIINISISNYLINLILVGGQYIKNALPKRYFFGKNPQYLLSRLEILLSPRA